MIEGIDFNGLDGFQQIQSVQQFAEMNQENMSSQMMGSGGDIAKISPIGNMISSIDQMDEGTTADFKDFMQHMQEEFQSGNFDGQSIANYASDNLTSFAQSQGIDLTEAVQKHANFIQIHRNVSGMYMGAPDQTAENLMSFLDENGDGVLDSNEAKIPGQIFEKLDQNNDGLLDKEEIEAASEMVQDGQKAGQKGSKGNQGSTEEVSAQIDTDGDSVVDTEEVTTYSANGDVEGVTTRPASGSGNSSTGI